MARKYRQLTFTLYRMFHTFRFTTKTYTNVLSERDFIQTMNGYFVTDARIIRQLIFSSKNLTQSSFMMD